MKGIVALICMLVVAHSALAKEISPPHSSTTEVSEPPVDCDISVEDPDDVVLLPDPESCEHYYICVGLVPIKRPCPAGLHWNAELRVCDWPELANCTVSAL